MEEEKSQEEITKWKGILASHPDDADISGMPDEVSDVLSRDPDYAPFIADAILRSLPDDGGSGAAPFEIPPELEEALDESGAGPEVEDELKESATVVATRARKEREDKEQKEEQAKKLSLMAKIARLDVGEKAKLARTGDKAVRSLLIKDANKQVSMAVMENPRITIQEIELISASRNVTEDILREIGKNKDWSKNYTVMLSLVNNPKTPVGVSLTHINKLLIRDLRFIAKSKGIPEAIRVTAKKIVQKKAI